MVTLLQVGLPKNPWLIFQQSQQITFFYKASRQTEACPASYLMDSTGSFHMDQGEATVGTWHTVRYLHVTNMVQEHFHN